MKLELKPEATHEEIDQMLRLILSRLSFPEFRVLHPDQIARLRGDHGPKNQVKELHHLCEIYEDEQARRNDLNAHARAMALLPSEEQNLLRLPLTYRASYFRRRQVRQLRSNLRELDQRFDQDLEGGLSVLASSSLVRQPREHREKPKTGHVLPWEVARKRVASGKPVSLGPEVILQPKRPKETPKSEEKRPDRKKQKRRAAA